MESHLVDPANAITLDDLYQARERIADRLSPTPLITARELSDALGCRLYLKGELFQRTGSFKSRGALNWVRSASREEVSRGLITVSAGNHAQALAWAAGEAGARVTVVMPANASPMKVEATRRYGGEVVLHGDINQALARMEALRRQQGLLLVHPYDNPRIIAGQGTVGLEIAEQLADADRVCCPIGGGGLISGIAVALKSLRPGIRVIGVEPARAATMRNAWDHRDHQARLDSAETLAASLGASVVGEYTYALTRRLVDDIVTVSEEDIIAGLRAMMTGGKLYAEPGACVPLAALLAGHIAVSPGEKVVTVVTGGNLDLEKARRFV